MNVLSSYAHAASIVTPESLTENTLASLEQIFTRPLVLAAFDLIDRSNVLEYSSPGGHYYQVFGSTASYQVFLDLPSPTPAYCTCPAFSYLLLSPESTLMCKHILAALFGRKLGRIIQRQLNPEELATTLLQE
ncbi:SWIM-type domain-containing protein [Mycena indigotica]|uniref:SWIM-type domain-containing protein n=1 Tax=Mycena indigotica TaxID=2126181 RepID=A0A8H6TDP8_9AGAR|nr:SWIM-type domain-containing protein [Mycena indigotica]KAF7315394.1 SWIM-type domain-containing protein [Mycena indigotica]